MNYVRTALLCSALIVAPVFAEQSASPSPLGATIVGDQEAAIGLFVTPWKEQAASTTDRPPRLFEVKLAPMDTHSFKQGLELQQMIDTQRIQRLHR
ncbi:MAG: hypothetical protein ACSHXK_08445 [Oceanococcus sp.]